MGTLPATLRKIAMIGIILGGIYVVAAHGEAGRTSPAAAWPLVDLQGKPAQIVRPEKPSKFFVFIFTRTDCPIANAYAPEIGALQAQFAPDNVEFWLVYGMDEPSLAVRKHMTEFRYRCEALYDPGHRFARLSQVTVTPEAAVYASDGKLLYHGRIDDRYAALGAPRSVPRDRDLQAALKAVIAGRSAPWPSKPAVGCLIE